MIYGYARVSTRDQNLEQQITALKLLEIEDKNIFREKMSTRKRLPELESLFSILAPGDKVAVLALDRLGRSVTELIRLVNELQARQVDFVCIKSKIDTSTAIGRLFFHMSAAFAEFERDNTRERILLGIAEARKKGHLPGRKAKISPEELETARELYAAGKSMLSIARMLKVHDSTVWRALKRIRAS